MPTDMKATIAEAALKLLTERRVKKLTVKDIVEECNITRQTFYYHFEDIPGMFSWIIQKFTDRMLKEVLTEGSAEDGLRCFFIMAVNAIPYIKRVMDSNYRAELEQISRRYIRQLFATAAESRNYYHQCSVAETKIIIRYHSLALMGILKEWTEQDTEQLDEIVHTVYRLMMEGILKKQV